MGRLADKYKFDNMLNAEQSRIVAEHLGTAEYDCIATNDLPELAELKPFVDYETPSYYVNRVIIDEIDHVKISRK